MFRTSLLAAALLSATAAPSFANPTVGGAPMLENMTIAQNASNAPNLTTLVAAVSQAGLVDTLMGPGPFTVFAPTNDAFAGISQASIEMLLMDENRAQLQRILTCHVVAAEAFSQDIAGMIAADGGMHEVTTVGGCKLQVYMEGGRIRIRDENGRVATVTTADVDQSNGVVHVIDKVILPVGMAG